MRTITKNIYTFNELSEEAKEKTIFDYREGTTEIFWADEILESLKGLFENCSSVELKDYSLGEYNSSIDVRFYNEETEEISGKRAFAWIENNLLCNIRYKQGISHIKERVWTSDCVKSVDRKDGYFLNNAGKIKECPFTGYYADDDFLDSLLKDIREGADLKTAFEGLASEYQKIINNEIDYQNSEEYIIEHMEANNYKFDENGEMI